EVRSEEERRGRPFGPIVVVVALLIVVGVGALAFAGMLPGFGQSPAATATPGIASGQPTVPPSGQATPTQLVQATLPVSAQAGPTSAPAKPTTARAKPTTAPAKPTTAPAQPTPAPTTLPAAQPTQPPAPQPTTPPAAKPTAPPAPLPDTIARGDDAQMRLVSAG